MKKVDFLDRTTYFSLESFRLYFFEIPYGYWGMESSCKNQELDPASVIKKAKTVFDILNKLKL